MKRIRREKACATIADNNDTLVEQESPRAKTKRPCRDVIRSRSDVIKEKSVKAIYAVSPEEIIARIIFMTNIVIII